MDKQAGQLLPPRQTEESGDARLPLTLARLPDPTEVGVDQQEGTRRDGPAAAVVEVDPQRLRMVGVPEELALLAEALRAALVALAHLRDFPHLTRRQIRVRAEVAEVVALRVLALVETAEMVDPVS